MKDHKYIRIVLYIISFIGVILHNEIVVINICGLGSDTKYFYDVLVKNEEEYSNADDPENVNFMLISLYNKKIIINFFKSIYLKYIPIKNYTILKKFETIDFNEYKDDDSTTNEIVY